MRYQYHLLNTVYTKNVWLLAPCCVLLTGLRGGRDLMNSRMISCALFFNLGGMSPFTWNNSYIHNSIRITVIVWPWLIPNTEKIAKHKYMLMVGLCRLVKILTMTFRSL